MVTNSKKTEFSISTDMLIVLIILSAIAVYYYGIRALIITLISSLTSVITDLICLKIQKRKSDWQDLSSLITGLVLALMMSAGAPYFAVIIAAAFSIIIGKHAFGGYGYAIFNCPAVGFLFISLCFSEFMFSYPKPFEYLPNESLIPVGSLYPSMTKSILFTDTSIVSIIDLVVGKFNGPMGTNYIIVLIISALFLVFRRSISAISLFTQLGIVFLFTFFSKEMDLIHTIHILSSGMLLFGIIFLSCDYSTIPKTKSSRFIYGIITAVLTLIFQYYAKVENAIVYAVIISAPLGIELDRRALSFAKMFADKDNKLNQKQNSISETVSLVNVGSEQNEIQSQNGSH